MNFIVIVLIFYSNPGKIIADELRLTDKRQADRVEKYFLICRNVLKNV
jgi:hypothetical protein